MVTIWSQEVSLDLTPKSYSITAISEVRFGLIWFSCIYYRLTSSGMGKKVTVVIKEYVLTTN